MKVRKEARDSVGKEARLEVEQRAHGVEKLEVALAPSELGRKEVA